VTGEMDLKTSCRILERPLPVKGKTAEVPDFKLRVLIPLRPILAYLPFSLPKLFAIHKIVLKE
jgi:hypothetical protein